MATISDEARARARALMKFMKQPSSRSDHLPVELTFKMNIDGIVREFKVGSYNTSFASDLGLLIPFGSEASFLRQLRDGQNKRHYMEKATSLIGEHFNTYSIVLIQEGNDAKRITYVPGVHDPTAFEDGKFIGGFQGMIKKLAATLEGTNTIIEDEKKELADGSYYNKGTFGDYCYVAYSVVKTLSNGIKLYPTVLTIWNKEELGDFENFYGKDLGLNDVYEQENKNNDNIHHGRPFSCVRTTKGVTIINMHGPNYVSNKPDIKGKLEPTILKYMKEAKKQFEDTWNTELTIVGGDLNDTEFELTSIEFEGKELQIEGTPPNTCCTNYKGQKHQDFTMKGDLIYAFEPLSELEIVHPFKSWDGDSDKSVGSPYYDSPGSPSSPGRPDSHDSDDDDDDDDDDSVNPRKVQKTRGGRVSYHILKKKKRKSIKKRHTIQYKSNNSRKYKKTKKSNKTKKTKKTKNSRKQKQTKKNN